MSARKSKVIWILNDLSNSHPEIGKNYVWQFPTRDAARAHLKAQHSKPSNARLSQPIKLTIYNA